MGAGDTIIKRLTCIIFAFLLGGFHPLHHTLARTPPQHTHVDAKWLSFIFSSLLFQLFFFLRIYRLYILEVEIDVIFARYYMQMSNYMHTGAYMCMFHTCMQWLAHFYTCNDVYRIIASLHL